MGYIGALGTATKAELMARTNKLLSDPRAAVMPEMSGIMRMVQAGQLVPAETNIAAMERWLAKQPAAKKGGGGGSYGLTAQMIKGVPNYLLYGAAAVVGVLVVAKVRGRKGKKAKR